MISNIAATTTGCTTTSVKNTDKKHIARNCVGGAVGLYIPLCILYEKFNSKPVSQVKKDASYMSKQMPDVDTFESTKNNIEKLLTDTGLKEKGVKLFTHDGSKESDKKFLDMLDEIAPGKSKLMQLDKEKVFNDMKYGANACYINKNKTIIISKRNLYTSAYHELGHAMNDNTNILTKMAAKARRITPFGLSILAPITLAVGLFHKVDKNKPAEQKNSIEKTLDFVSDNAGKLTFASYAPLLAEEGLASIRGIHQAKKVLPEDKISKLAKNYFKAWGSYATLATYVSAGVGLGVMIANGSIKRTLIKNNPSPEL